MSPRLADHGNPHGHGDCASRTLIVVGVATAFIAGRRSAPGESAVRRSEPVALAADPGRGRAPDEARPSMTGAVIAAEPAIAPSGDGCVTRTEFGDTFHLRPTDTTSRVGALELPGGLAVRVLNAGAAWRSGGASRSYRVRIIEGSAAGSEGYIFLHKADLAGRVGCPQ